VRTGQTFPVWTATGAGTSEVCRFFSATFAPKSSHFYTPYPRECASLRQGTTWTYEGTAFHLKLTNADGNCTAGTVPLYRLYNDGAGDAPNHRYTASRTVFEQMRARGWTAEGNGPQIIFACLPAGGVATEAVGLWEGTTSANEDLLGVVLADGSFYLVYTAQDGASSMGMVQGTASFVNGSFASTGARDYVFAPSAGSYPATFSGSYVPGASMSGSVSTSQRFRSITAQPVPGMYPPMSLPTTTMTFSGAAATLGSATFGNVTLDPRGGLSGQLLGCTIGGTVTPRSDVRAADATITIGGSLCALGRGTMTGIAIYEYESGVGALILLARNDSQSDACVFAGFATP
jgi:hypothetical protein